MALLMSLVVCIEATALLLHWLKIKRLLYILYKTNNYAHQQVVGEGHCHRILLKRPLLDEV